MLKCEISDNNVAILTAGSLKDVTGELAYLISVVWGRLYLRDQGAAQAFRRSLLLLMTDPSSPIFDPAEIERPKNGIDLSIIREVRDDEY